MSRKHFIKLAEAQKWHADKLPPDRFWDLVDDVVDVCARDNGRFDRQRFRRACGVDEWNHPRRQEVSS